MRMFRCGLAPALGLVLWLAGLPAYAQMLSPGYGTYGAPMSNFLASSFLVQQAANGTVQAARQARPAAAAAAPGPIAPQAQAPIAPGQLARHYPQAQRDAAARYFQQVLETYAKLERQTGLPPRDLAGAMAAFIAGNWLMLTGKPVPDDDFLALAKQMRGVMAGLDALSRAQPAELQEMYEQFAILGTHMALVHVGLQQQPNAALAEQARQAARGYLQQFLQADPQRLSFGPQGVTVR